MTFSQLWLSLTSYVMTSMCVFTLEMPHSSTKACVLLLLLVMNLYAWPLGSIPPELGRMTALEELRLSGNLLSGE